MYKLPTEQTENPNKSTAGDAQNIRFFMQSKKSIHPPKSHSMKKTAFFILVNLL